MYLTVAFDPAVSGDLEMEWSEHLYTGRAASRHASKIRRKLNKGDPVIGEYLITLSAHPGGQLDIIRTESLIFPYIRSHLPVVVGMAGSREEARELVVRMLGDCLKESGNADLKSYCVMKSKKK